jgi:hypothetical protein
MICGPKWARREHIRRCRVIYVGGVCRTIPSNCQHAYAKELSGGLFALFFLEDNDLTPSRYVLLLLLFFLFSFSSLLLSISKSSSLTPEFNTER